MPTETTSLLPRHGLDPEPEPGQTARGAWAGWASKAIAILVAALVAGGAFGLYFHQVRGDYYDEFPLDGGFYEFSDVSSGLYIRVDDTNGGVLTLSKSFPWLSGSNIEVSYSSAESCFKLLSMSGKWVRTGDGTVRADAAAEKDADCISFKPHGDGRFSLTARAPSDGKDRYIIASIAEYYLNGVYDIGLITSDTNDAAAIFNINRYVPLRGVNLGGWFIPEYWMMPSFYAGTSLKWNGSLCSFTRINPALAEERITNNIENWIVEDDISQIAKLGFNSVRIPIGYWNVIKDPYDLFVPKNTEISLDALDWCFSVCEKYNITVLVDLHGGPGSQNGQDHSGCQMGEGWSSERNIQLSLDTIKALLKRYGSRGNFLGIELLNEPSFFLEQSNHTRLVRYYEQAYRIVRDYSSTGLVIFNDIYKDFYTSWDFDLREPEYYNVALDLHLYDWQEPFTFESAEQHILDAQDWKLTIQNLSLSHPIIVGEWSFSTGILLNVGQSFVNTTLASFEAAMGWYVWTWKLEEGVGFDIWNVQLQSRLADGIRLYL